jgi:hypothetical protein
MNLTQPEVDEIARRMELIGLPNLAAGFRDPQLRAAAGPDFGEGCRALLAVDADQLPGVVDFLVRLPSWEEIPPRIWSDHHTAAGGWCRWSLCAVAAHVPDEALCPDGCRTSAVIENPELAQ